MLLEQVGPDHEVGDVGLVLQRDEHDALGRARLLADQHQAGKIDPATVLHRAKIRAQHYLAQAQLVAEERQRMRAQRQADRAVILHYLGALAHRRERYGRLIRLGP